MQSYFRSSLLSRSKDDRKYACFCKSLVTVITGSLPLNSLWLEETRTRTPGMQSYFRSSLLPTSKDDRKYVCVCKSLLTVIIGSLPLNSFSLFRRKCKTCRGVPRLLNQLRRHHCLASVPFFARPKPKIPFLFLCSETRRKRLSIALVMATGSTYLGTGSAYSSTK